MSCLPLVYNQNRVVNNHKKEPCFEPLFQFKYCKQAPFVNKKMSDISLCVNSNKNQNVWHFEKNLKKAFNGKKNCKQPVYNVRQMSDILIKTEIVTPLLHLVVTKHWTFHVYSKARARSFLVAVISFGHLESKESKAHWEAAKTCTTQINRRYFRKLYNWFHCIILLLRREGRRWEYRRKRA